jgi:hypothetical protein
MDDEQYVRSKWKRVEYRESGLTPAGPYYVTISGGDHPTAGSLIFMNHGISKEAVFVAARAFTEEREKQIAEVEKEIAWLIKEKRGQHPEFETQTARELYATPRRIFAREQAALNELKRGMKGLAQ